MKKQISFLTFIFSLLIITMIFISCAKEEIIPIAATQSIPNTNAPSADETDATSPVFLFLESALKNGVAPEADITLPEVLERLSLDVDSRWGVDIKAFACVRRGHTLIAHNPNHPSLDFYDSRRFLTLWFKDNRPMRSNGIRIECVCRGKYAAVVLNKATQQGVGIAFYSVGACSADESPSTINNGTD